MEIILIILLSIVLGVFISKIMAVDKRLAWLEWELHKLKHQIDSIMNLEKAKQDLAAAPSREEQPTPLIVPAAPPIAEQPIQPDVSVPIRPVYIEPPSEAPKSRTREEWEALIGGKLLNRIGALALVIGIGFFLKYAFDNNWISETVRVLIGAGIGLAVLLGGERAQKKGFEIFAQGLQGAGIAILYLSVYASFNYYHLVSQTVAFLFMAIVTVIAFVEALRYDSNAIGLLGWAGGYLTPILLSTGVVNDVGFLSYILVLTAGLLAVVMFREKWFILEILTVLAALFMYLLWFGEEYNTAKFWIAFSFLTILWLMVFGLEIVRALNKERSYSVQRGMLASGFFLFYFIDIYVLLNERFPDWAAPVALLIGFIYFSSGVLLKRQGKGESFLFERYILSSMFALVCATAIQFTGFTTIALWSIEAAILFWLGMRLRLIFLGQAALLIILLGLMKLIATNNAFRIEEIQEYVQIIPHRILAFVALAAALRVIGYCAHRIEDKWLNSRRAIFHAGWSLTLFILITVWGVDYFRFLMLDQSRIMVEYLYFLLFISLSSLWMVFGILITYNGLIEDNQTIGISGLVYAGLGTSIIIFRGLLFSPIEQYTFLFNYRVLACLGIIGGLTLLTIISKSRSSKFDWIDDVQPFISGAILVVIFSLLTGEARDYFEWQKFILHQSSANKDVSDQLLSLQNQQQLALSSVWLFYSILLMVVGIWRRHQMIRVASIILFGVTILKIFIYDLSSLETLYRIFSFIGLGVILLMTSYLYQRYKGLIFEVRQK
ncbi:MAG: DUF2339 domain-containing protein [bacterium]